MIGSLRAVDPAGIKLGQAVQVSVEPRNDEFAYLWADVVEA